MNAPPRSSRRPGDAPAFAERTHDFPLAARIVHDCGDGPGSVLPACTARDVVGVDEPAGQAGFRQRFGGRLRLPAVRAKPWWRRVANA